MAKRYLLAAPNAVSVGPTIADGAQHPSSPLNASFSFFVPVHTQNSTHLNSTS